MKRESDRLNTGNEITAIHSHFRVMGKIEKVIVLSDDIGCAEAACVSKRPELLLPLYTPLSKIIGDVESITTDAGITLVSPLNWSCGRSIFETKVRKVYGSDLATTLTYSFPPTSSRASRKTFFSCVNLFLLPFGRPAVLRLGSGRSRPFSSRGMCPETTVFLADMVVPFSDESAT